MKLGNFVKIENHIVLEMKGRMRSGIIGRVDTMLVLTCWEELRDNINDSLFEISILQNGDR